MKLKTLKTIIKLTDDYKRNLRRALANYRDFKNSSDDDDDRERIGYALMAFDYTCKAKGIWECCMSMDNPLIRDFIKEIDSEVYAEFNVPCNEEYCDLLDYLEQLREIGNERG